MGVGTELDTLQERRCNYSEVSHLFQDGDVFMFRGESSISKIFRVGAGSAYSHVGVAAWWYKRLMLFHAAIDNLQVLPLSFVIHKYNGLIDWYTIKPELRHKLDVSALVSEAQNNIGLSYGAADMLRTVLHDVVGMRMPEDEKRPDAMFCSQYVARCFRMAGLPLSNERDSEMFPAEVCGSDVLQYAGTLIPNLQGDPLRSTLDRV